MSTHANPKLTPEEYLARERAAEYKSEYYGGEIFAMAGAGRIHIRLGLNLERILYSQLPTSCSVYVSEMRVFVPSTELYTYPDVVVTCGEKFLDGTLDTLLNPTLIAEVLSPSTEAYDRGRKFEHYQTIESFQQYMLIAQDRIRVDLYTRQAGGGGWLMQSATQLSDTVEIASIGCRISVDKLYERVEFVK